MNGRRNTDPPDFTWSRIGVILAICAIAWAAFFYWLRR